MPCSQDKIDYNAFMLWFQQAYPTMFNEYRDNIILAKDSTGLKVDIYDLDQETYNTLFEIQNEFYCLSSKE